MFVRYEDLCGDSAPTLESIFAHAKLAEPGQIIDRYRNTLAPPTYYSADFTDAEERAIVEECDEVAGALGYDLRASQPPSDGPRVA